MEYGYSSENKVEIKGIDPRRAINVAFVEHLDAGIGRVMETLRTTGLDKNTVVVFTNDNGGSLPHHASNDPLRGGKTEHYEGGIKVPTVMVLPGRIRPGSETPVLSLTMNLLPTFLDIAGHPVLHAIDGISLWPYINGEDPGTSDRVVFGKAGVPPEYSSRPFRTTASIKLLLTQHPKQNLIPMRVQYSDSKGG